MAFFVKLYLNATGHNSEFRPFNAICLNDEIFTYDI